MSQFDKRIKVNTIIENQLPEFVSADFPNAVEFFKQYYISQEFQGGPTDLISNFDQYLKVDNLVPEVVVGVTSITTSIESTDTTINVPSTKGFPTEYGLLKIDDEIISYTGITSTSFTGCLRGFSGVTGYNVGISSSLLDVNKESLKFEETTASSHVNGSVVNNLSVLFLQEFYKKLKKTFLPGFENSTLASDLDVGNFVKFARSFYRSKGVEESIRVLFKVLYGVESRILDLENNVIKPSDAEYIRREVIIADLITEDKDPQNLVGQTIFKNNDLGTNASVSEVEIFNRDGKTYYKIALFVGYSDRDLIQGIFSVTPHTKVLSGVSTTDSIITVDSTIGFGNTGILKSGTNTIEYKSKSLNQFFGCEGIDVPINTADSIRNDDFIFGYENGDATKKVELRITGVLSKLVTDENLSLIREGEKIFVKNVGEKILNESLDYRQKFVNSWIYNSSSRFQVGVTTSQIGGTIKLNTKIDKSSIKDGDTFQVLRRNETTADDFFTIPNGGVNLSDNQISVQNLNFNPVLGEEYDIRRVIKKASSSGIEIREGNNNIMSDILNVYVDGTTDGYVASNSLPSYTITDKVIDEKIIGIAQTTTNFSLDGLNPDTDLYSFLSFNFDTIRDIKFIRGDAIVYNSVKDPNSTDGNPSDIIPGLNDGEIYYVDPQPEQPGTKITRIALYLSRAQIGTASTVQIGLGQSLTDQHIFTLQRHHDKKISANKILRKFPLDQNLFNATNNDENVDDIGLLKDGVEIRSPISEDFISYGGITKIDVINGGSGYDVNNPPKIFVESSTGEQALAEPVLSGSVEKVLIDPQDFDIASVKNISLTGGNGTGCVLEAITGERYRELEFNSKDIFFGGGIDIEDETITFTRTHNLENGELVYYLNNGNPSIGIGAAYDGTNTITGTLASGDPYYVRVVNSTTVRIYNTKNDALSGINTVGLSTDTAASGIHAFRTISKNTITDIKVINSGEGYQHRKLIVKPSGISTSFNTINFVNHGFNHGDLVDYAPMVGIGSTMPKEIQGLSTTTSYYVMKVDDNSFKLANAGVGGTSIVDFERGKIVGLNSTGTGYQTFKYPDIKVNLEVGYGGTITGDFNITPYVKGSFTDAYVYETGSDYGSKILNTLINPSVTIDGGKNAELKPIVSNGKIIDVVIVDQGENYFSKPDITITSSDGSGVGAIVRPVIENGKLIDTVVINSGIGYNELTTNAYLDNSGLNGNFEANVRVLRINEKGRTGDTVLVPRGDFLSFCVIGCDQELISNLEVNTFNVTSSGDFDTPAKHSSIIGWAYDGNPIYGPFGYTEPNNINSPIKLIESSYAKDSTKVENRPTGFIDGYFVDDFVYDASGDLDIHNGRFCKTPEFPNGVYAYFATVEVNINGKLNGSYPYFIGKTFRSPLIKENLKLTHDFDFNNSNLIRNTYPYNVGEEFANNDFIIESNEFIRQSAEVTSVSKGEVESITILNPGTGYKVGDRTSFDNTDTNGTGLNAEVSDIVGLGVSSIQTNLTTFEDVVFTWENSNQVNAKYLPFLELNDKDNILVSGLNKSILGLSDSFTIGVTTSRVKLLAPTKTVASGSLAIEDIFVSKIPNDVSIGGTIRVGSGNTSASQPGTIDETMMVINIFPLEKAIRVVRNTGVAHTYGSNVDILNTVISIPASTTKFESQLNDVVYFNAPQQIGLGTDGEGISTNYFVGDRVDSVSIPNRQIYLPNHPFVTGQKVKLNVPNTSNKQLNVATSDDPNDSDGNFSIPFTGNSQDLFVIKKSNNYIGLSTVAIGSTSEGLYFKSNASNVSGINTHLYNITSQFEQVTGDIDKVISTLTTKVAAANTTTHNLQNGDIVTINVVPNLSVGLGKTTPVQVDYNTEFEKLIVDPIKFVSADVETDRIDIANHGFETGDKVLYTGDGSGIANGLYFVHKINSRYFQLAETYNDLYSNPINLINITANTGGNNQVISLVNPQIKVYKNSKLTFGLSTTNLADFDFKIFNENGENEYLSSLDSTTFNVQRQGTIGIGTNLNDLVGATLTLQSSASTPLVLYYGLTKGGFISTADTDVQNYSQIVFVDSIYNGDYKISNVTDESFEFSPKVPEILNYDETNCDVIEYSTKSKNVNGGIKNIEILSNGFNYKRPPVFKEVLSVTGANANLVAESKNIGKIENIRVLDIGYEYSADKTLQPEVFVPSIINIDNLDQITEIDIVDGGSDYTTPPNLVVFNPTSNIIVDELSLDPKAPEQSISSVDIIAPISGLDSVEHKIFAINNSNGIGINSIQSSSGGIVTCFMETPFNGFLDPQPFAVGDEIYVEGIQRLGEAGIGTQGGAAGGDILGEGFNSADHHFQFFKVISYTPGTTTIVKYSVAGVTTNPGIAKTFQSGYASIINKNKYPQLVPVQSRGVFQQNEALTLNGQDSDLTVVEIRNDYIKLDGLDYIKKGDRILGKVTGVSAEIVNIKNNLAKFEIDFSSRQDIGWIDDIGKLNDDTQVTPNNDYYQNLSYSVKSPIPWDKFSNSLNSIIHPAGLKNFSDTFVETKTRVGVGTTVDSINVTILDIVSDDNRVDAINNFDNALDFNSLGNKSKSLLLSEKKLTNFNKCITNRVLIHDDVSDEFSSVGFAANSTILNEITGKFVHYLIQVVDPDTFDAQLSELVILTTQEDVFLVEKSSDSAGVGLDNVDGNLRLGTFDTEIKSDGTKNLLFNPSEKFTKDHDVKMIKTFYDVDALGVTTSVIGNIQLVSANVGIASATQEQIQAVGFNTTTVVEFNKDEFNGLHATIFVQDSLTKEINYNEITVDFDGVDTTTSQIYIDDRGTTNTSNTVGIITTRLEGGLVKIQIENDRENPLDAKANIVGLGTITAGIGTFRFLASGQPQGAERSARFESTVNTGTGTSISYANLDKTLDSSIKSLIRVSTGQTSAIHQVVAVRDAEDILVVQYPYVSLGSTTGIGSFISDTNGDNISLLFVPDSEFTDEVTVQAYNQILNTESDFDNLPGTLKYGAVEQDILLSTYDGLAGRRANKTKFDLTFEGTPIYSKTFNPDGANLEKSTGIFTLPSHFFNTGEEITYEPTSTFIGVAATAVSIGATINNAGVTTDILPSTVFAKVISEDKFQLFPTKEDITSGIAITFTGIGAGNAHKLNMSNKLSKTIIGLDGVVQQPITFTELNYTLGVNIGAATTQFSLSGISSISTFDVLKIDDEYMKIIEVGFSSTSDGSGKIDDQLNVSLGISNIPTVRVERGVLGVGATSHNNGDVIRVHRGSFNIVDSSIHFIEPPKGNTRTRRTETEIPFVKANFSGRTFLRQSYDTNMLFDDISDNFTGLTTAYNLKVGGANTSAGIDGRGNGVVFINGVFQTPDTANNTGNEENYNVGIDTIAGISTIRFTGITSENGQFIVSDSDINQNQIPRGGLIVSLGSTEGLGYAPLHGANVKAEKNSNGELTGIVGIGTSSGFNIGIQTAEYDNNTGIITVTTNDVHGFGLNKPTTVKLKGLEFKCPKTVVGQPTNANYTPSNGNLVITINNHGLVNGDAVVLETDSFVFTCTKDSNATNHSYPRATDPAANQYLTVSNVTTNTFRVNVGASAPGDQYTHTFVSATATAVQTIGGGGYVGVTTTIFQDHERGLFVVGIVSERTFEVKAGASTIPHTYQGGGHVYEFYEDLTFGSGYRGGSVAIGVTDIAYEHRFVSSGIGSIKKGTYNGDSFTATDAFYESHSGLLTLTIPDHTFTTSDTVGIDTGGIVFKCSKDAFLGNHPYPRAVSKTSFPNSDPFAGTFVSVGSTSLSTITFNVGAGGGGGTGAVVTATVGVGGSLSFDITSPGTGYVNPEIIIPEPVYENLEVVGISRLGVGATTDTGSNLLLNVGVSAASTSVGIGSTLFQIKDFEVARSGHSFKKGDKFKPVGLVTAAHLTSPIQEFELEVLEIFNDKFSAWQFGQIDAIDSIKILQNGTRTRFPLFFNGELLSFEKTLDDPRSALIDLDAVLLIFINGVLQKPGEAYQFQGGTTFTFTEPPSGESGPGLNDHDKVDIYFYKGTDNVDVKLQNVSETIKIGDNLRVFANPTLPGITTSQQKERIVKEILNTDILDTDIYTGLGIDEKNEKPIRWTKQKTDFIINGQKIDKSRSILEPQIYPTSKIIGNLTSTSGKGVSNNSGIFVDDATQFFYENKYDNFTVDSVDALITSGEIKVGASATAIVSTAGTITDINITNAGSGYESATVKIGNPLVGIHTFIQSDGTVGVATTATATATITNGSITDINITNPGFGYSNMAPPQVIIDEPKFKTEKVNGFDQFEGYTGIITGITQITRSGGGPALRFDYYGVVRQPNGTLNTNIAANTLKQGYPVLITDTNVGNGLTSVEPGNANIVGIGTTFVDNVYIVNSIITDGATGTIICHVHTNSASSISGINTEGFFDGDLTSARPLGKLSWGRIYGNDVARSSNPISIGVSGFTVNSGLTTFPTIQRKSYDDQGEKGHRNSGSIRAIIA